jgi:hypothetical protein
MRRPGLKNTKSFVYYRWPLLTAASTALLNMTAFLEAAPYPLSRVEGVLKRYIFIHPLFATLRSALQWPVAGSDGVPGQSIS